MILAGILIIAALLIFQHVKNKKTIAEIAPAKLVQIAPVTIKMLPKTIQTSGNLIADNNTIITPRVSGYIKAINVTEGQSVQAGAVLFQLDQDKEKDALRAAKANYQLSAAELIGDKSLLKKNYIARDDYATAIVTAKQNQAAMDTAETNLIDRQICAPFSGTISSISASPGQLVNPGVKLTELVDTQHLRIEYTLPVKSLSEVKLNQPVMIKDLSGKNSLVGTVSYISPDINQQTQMLSVHASVNNPNQLFKPGEYVNITQILSSSVQTILVPEQSISGAQDHYSVFIVKNNKAVRVTVTIGDRSNGFVVIKSGLTPQDQIITSEMDELHTGQAVKVVGIKAVGK